MQSSLRQTPAPASPWCAGMHPGVGKVRGCPSRSVRQGAIASAAGPTPLKRRPRRARTRGYCTLARCAALARDQSGPPGRQMRRQMPWPRGCQAMAVIGRAAPQGMGMSRLAQPRRYSAVQTRCAIPACWPALFWRLGNLTESPAWRRGGPRTCAFAGARRQAKKSGKISNLMPRLRPRQAHAIRRPSWRRCMQLVAHIVRDEGRRKVNLPLRPIFPAHLAIRKSGSTASEVYG